ncbi:TPM domain-containing protein [Sphingomonas morindae]|uniref:TPM domain-containing protein n=1 Tax=Sphingomonas morindae TaxID=1541170 RepID=A0ABY4X3E1_9SPHN|nr:TPM domain-containing protein [Sphingomonas morindae]USI71395.1 TPM domain-containing protein [Sphingomonas morindae]
MAPGRAPAFRPARATSLVLLALLGWLMLVPAARAQSFPAFTGLVVDAAHVLPPDRAAALEAKLQALQKATSRQLVVATVPSLEGRDIQDYGYRLGRAWQVGLKGADNGVILLVAPNERRVGIETGYGVEGVVTDAYSKVLIESRILPAFKAGDMAGGIEAGADALIQLLSLPDDQARARQDAAVAAWNKEHARRPDAGGAPWGLILWLIVIGVVLAARFARSSGRRYDDGGLGVLLWGADIAAHMMSRGDGGWRDGGAGGGHDDGGGGWTGGGFTGGGGGSFGGGGASGSW